ncbi:ABC transporter permease [Aliidongia dinghuensis]|uniref:ABC transporter permease n=1 Tax=Aliidongia dinghuensis TaxID=1867774 RepID=A0A8J2YQP0_9PROT|nr:ABC transporter permease [Aliidongia dinghuensis]GGF05847.1 ABC transporter permease [Aliidongia dinghuensis]
MSPDTLVSLLATTLTAATPLLLAAIGELVVERAGVLNLGVEGMMLTGAVSGFAAMALTGSHALALLAAILAGMGLAAVFGFLVLTLMSNQVATGLALTIFGTGLSALIGTGFTGEPVPALPKLMLPGLSTLPILGKLFEQDALVYFAVFAVAAVAWFLRSTRAGLVLRAVGEADLSAHSIGYPVLRIRFLAILFGGAMAGLGGAYLSLAYTPMWVENMTAGRGWIALAIVVFAAWRPWRAAGGAYLFGGVTVLQLYLQGSGLLPIPPQLLSMLPYLGTILVLTLISSGPFRRRFSPPACLGKPFRPPA